LSYDRHLISGDGIGERRHRVVIVGAGFGGLFGPFIPRAQLKAFLATHPTVTAEHVRDTNHHTLILGDSPGPAAVAAAIGWLVRDTRAGWRREGGL
jgi:hypothetical protein